MIFYSIERIIPEPKMLETSKKKSTGLNGQGKRSLV